MRSPEGHEHGVRSVYREIDRPERIVYTAAFADEHANPVDDMPEQLGTVVHALGGEIQSVMTFGQGAPGTPEEIKDNVMHLSLVAGGNTLLMSESVFGPISQGNGLSLSLEFTTEAEAREAFSNLAEGGEVKFPFDQQPWGAYYGEIKDKYGLNWMIVKQN